ncbi:hypothetical protein ANN_01911 [Periplaneta americana]|uniref:Uncharacterized protein n=1 Tax=Periplaneta americana TaxID=6978 RepID=A0ABQ8TWG7_PERAM|nr:hypothetical protein ANN_01911 [Periplaneta americana]
MPSASQTSGFNVPNYVRNQKAQLRHKLRDVLKVLKAVIKCVGAARGKEGVVVKLKVADILAKNDRLQKRREISSVLEGVVVMRT